MITAPSMSKFKETLDKALRHMVGFFGCPVQDQVLDSMFQLGVFYDSMKESEEQTGCYWPRWFAAFGYQQNTSVSPQENSSFAVWEDNPTEGMEGVGSPHYMPREAPPGRQWTLLIPE